jgi:hypothetical protein
METTNNYKEIYKLTTFEFEGLEPFRYDTVATNREFAILTAWNPNNEEQSLEINRANNERLKIKLLKENYEIVFGTGGLGEYFEESYLVWDITFEEAFDYGIEFEQYSIFYNDHIQCGYFECFDSTEILVNFKDFTSECSEQISPAMAKSIERKKALIKELLEATNNAVLNGKNIVVDDFSYDKETNKGYIYLTIDEYTLPVPLSFKIEKNYEVMFDSNLIHSPFGAPASYGFEPLSKGLNRKVEREIFKRVLV